MNNITRIVDYLKAHAATEPEPEPEPEYTCNACKDTGWIEVDDGLIDGRRVRSPREARCTSLIHQREFVKAMPTPERFT